ncbi:uncharacterized protein LOC118439087 [Folsomia candida]|nr:uncharacterized protein LOC118439087 [Folsomia candida]XP_035716011.1 uncharacterized protein LOC118439087 [Folsomia candida]
MDPFDITGEHISWDDRQDQPIRRIEGVKNLQIGNIRDFLIISQPNANPFPNVTHLTINNIQEAEYMGNFAETANLPNVLRMCATWKYLTHLEIVIGGGDPRLSQILEALESLDVDTGLSELRITSLSSKFPKAIFDDLPSDDEKLTDFITKCSPLNRLIFQGVWWMAESVIRVTEFFARRGSPHSAVNFEGGYGFSKKATFEKFNITLMENF